MHLQNDTLENWVHSCLHFVVHFLVVDSMAKPPPGLLSGVTSFLGDFDQCISVTSPESTSEPFHGQYCLLKPVLPLPTMKKYLGESDENLINETKIMDYLATYKLDNYVKTNPVLKFIERMRSINGRVLNIALCVPDLCSSKQLEISFNRRMALDSLKSIIACLI